MQVVIRSDSHKKKNEYMEKYSYLITKHTAQKKCMCKNFFLRPQADRFVRLFVGRLRWIQQDARTSSVVFTFIDVFHWKFCRQNYSTGQIKVKQGVTLSVWIVYDTNEKFSFASFLSFSGDFYRFWQFVCFASFSSCLKEFHKRSSGHFATSPQTRENLFWQ